MIEGAETAIGVGAAIISIATLILEEIQTQKERKEREK